jgi:hypothetical protein
MKKALAFTMFAVAGSMAPAASAAQGAMKAPPSATRTVTGTVIDVSCKFGQGLSGADHKMCSEVCADRGIPLAILGDDGKLYLATSAGMPGDGQNAKLKAFAEQKVTVTGKVFAAAGASAIQIDRIAAVR